jgi:hypothetical protein
MRHEISVQVANAVTPALMLRPSLDGKWVFIGDTATLTVIDPSTGDRVSTGMTVWTSPNSGSTWLRTRDLAADAITSDVPYDTIQLAKHEAERLAEIAYTPVLTISAP